MYAACSIPSPAHFDRRPKRPRRWRAERCAFTTVELMVVLGIIALILAMGLPAFNSMTAQADRTQARQAINSALMRAHVLSVSDQTLAAVRFVPQAWEIGTDGASGGAALGTGAIARGPQVAAVYEFRFSWLSPNPGDLNNTNQSNFVQFNERFERVDDIATKVLPGGLWVAPAEALLNHQTNNFNGQAVLSGTPGKFEIDAADPGENFFDADDFLIVFDPRTGVRPARWPGNARPDLRRSPWQLYGLDPQRGFQVAWETNNVGRPLKPLRAFRRFNFTGVTLYDREPFLDIQSGDVPQQRQDFLRSKGQTFYVNRNGGGLLPAGGNSP